jgi:hypothetical protein
MTQRLADRAAAAVGRRTSRRGFLNRTAMAGTAMAVAPTKFLLEPVSAYQATCACSGQLCGCGSRCCDGYTEFCCTITGANRCPPGTELGGWWKADGSGYCGGPRYYLDCNVLLNAGPVCSCGCANGDCRNRKACCTRFRYGQCHQEIARMGAIQCRVVTCTPPWELDPTCTTTLAVDQNTRFHDAPCLHEEEEEEDDMPPAPAICIDSSGRRWIFVRGTDGALWARTDTAPWARLGGSITSGPSATAYPDGRITVAARGGDGQTFIITYNGSAWGGWAGLGGQS